MKLLLEDSNPLVREKAIEGYKIIDFSYLYGTIDDNFLDLLKNKLTNDPNWRVSRGVYELIGDLILFQAQNRKDPQTHISKTITRIFFNYLVSKAHAVREVGVNKVEQMIKH